MSQHLQPSYPRVTLRPTIGRQRGFVAFIGTLGAALVMLVALWIWQAANARTVIDRNFGVSESLLAAEQAVLSWHERNPALGEPYLFADRLPVYTIRRLSGVSDLPYAIALQRTATRSTRNGVAYTEYTVSIRPVDGSTALLDPATGLHQRTFSTETLQVRLTATTNDTLRALGARYEDYFASRARGDPSHDAGINYFRPPTGDCVATGQDVPCLDSFSVATSAAIPPFLASGIPTSDAWGRPIEVRNALPTVNALSPPFTMQIRALPPGVADVSALGAPAPTASPLVVTAVQRLE